MQLGQLLNHPDDMLGMWPLFKKDKREQMVQFIFNNSRLIQKSIIKGYHPKSRWEETIRMIPIIANCTVNTLQHYKEEVVTFNGTPELWDDFWKFSDSYGNEEKERILKHHFKFNYVIGFTPRQLLCVPTNWN